MKKYELICAVKTNLDIDGVEKIIQNISDNVVTLGGNVLNIDKIGRKKLAYEIKKFRDGFFMVFDLELPEDKVVELRRYIRLNEDILRDLITAKSNVAIASK